MLGVLGRESGEGHRPADEEPQGTGGSGPPQERRSEMKWTEVREPPCKWCPDWIGPHRHSRLPNGRIGYVIERLTEAEAAKVSES